MEVIGSPLVICGKAEYSASRNARRLAHSIFDLFSIVKRIVAGFRDHGERPRRLGLVSDAATKRRSRRNIHAVGAPSRRVIALIGDGSFQLTAQEVAQMIRRKLPVVIFLVNNHGYTIEVEIHDGPYNNIKNWDYAGLIQVFNAEEGAGAESALPMARS